MSYTVSTSQVLHTELLPVWGAQDTGSGPPYPVLHTQYARPQLYEQNKRRPAQETPAVWVVVHWARIEAWKQVHRKG